MLVYYFSTIQVSKLPHYTVTQQMNHWLFIANIHRDPHVQVNDQFHPVTYITWTKQILKAILGPAPYPKSQISGHVAEAAEAMPWPIRLPANTVAQVP